MSQPVSQPSFSRFDSVATRILLLLALVGTAVGSLVLPALDWARGRALTAVVDTGHGGTLQLDSAIPRPGVGVSWPGTARVRLEDPPGASGLGSSPPGQSSPSLWASSPSC